MTSAGDICWNKVCETCECDGSWVKSEEFWFLLMEEVMQQLYKFFYFKSDGDKNIAMDCAQETLVRFYKSVESNAFDYRKKLKPYLWRIARNYWYTYLRKSYTLIESVPLEFIERVGEKDPELTKAERLEAHLTKLKVVARKAGLSNFQIKLIILRYLYDLKPKEIALLINAPAKRVIDELYRARKKIKEVLNCRLGI